MAAHLVGLRFAAAGARIHRASPARIARAALAAVVVLAAAIGVGSLALAPASTAAVAIVGIGSALVAVFFAVPFAVTPRDPVDPHVLATLPVSAPSAAARLGLASLVSAPVAAAVALEAGIVVASAAHGAPIAIVVVAALVHLVTCALAARAGFAAAGRLLRGRRSAESAAIVAAIGAFLLACVAVAALALPWGGGAPAEAEAVARALAVTPFGAAAALAVVPAPGPAVAAVVTVAALAGVWFLIVRAGIRSLPREAERRETQLGWFAVLPRDATGVIGARSLFYWATDVRYLANVVIVPLAGLLPVVPLLVAGVPASIVAFVPLPIVATFLGWIAHNDLAYDSEAVWIHLVTGVRGAADRAGRLVPVLVIGIPLLAVAVIATCAVSGRWDAAPALIGVAVALFLSGLGLSSVASVVAPYAVARPGDSPFRQPQRSGSRASVAPTIVLALTIAAGLPALIPAGRFVFAGEGSPLVALVAGGAVGVVVLAAGLAIGAAVFDRRGHRILESATRAA
ncbi:hypothetical protein [Microbacterium indicum]|uniref:hypothetical protein n=1 Tax=Microbacterium indicum TaxID=358100 RepID=UPI0003FD7FEE|nr:hypothetical protein [Microbacterium indicum]